MKLLINLLKRTKAKVVIKNYKGIILSKLSFFNKIKFNYKDYVLENNQLKFDIKIAKTIIEYFDKIPPFYDHNVRKELKIGGAWKSHILSLRKNQLKIIENRDVEEYHELLNNMFRNELLTGMAYPFPLYSDPVTNGDVFNRFIKNLDGFKYLTGKNETELTSPSYGNPWGFRVGSDILKPNDPETGIKAFHILNLLNSIEDGERILTLVDLGSGSGMDIENVLRWYKKPIRVILVDIPLNLTTAYSFISACQKNANIYLVDNIKMLHNILNSPCNGVECIFVPTLFTEELKNVEIDVVFNHGSFSEMDYHSIQYYLKILVHEKTKYLLEINNNKEKVKHIDTDDFIEIASSKFPIPETHILLSRNPTWQTPTGHRYLYSLYVNKKLNSKD